MELENKNEIQAVNAKTYLTAWGIMHSQALPLRPANTPIGIASSSDQTGQNI